MKKKLSVLLSLLLVVGLMLSLAACKPADNNPTQNPGGSIGTDPTKTPGGDNPGGDKENPLAGTYDISVWVSEIEGVADLTAQQIDAFEAANPGIVINAKIEGVQEGESATQMITSVEDGADIFCFAQDQLARLVMAGALNKLGQGTAEKVKAENDAGAVAAASVGGELYCFPLTSDNGYFMFYDKSVIPEEHLGSLEQIIADCEAANRNFSYELEGSAWYNAGFFFATGCHSNWTTDTEGKFTAVDDNFNSEQGVIALRGMQKLLQSKCYVNSSNHADFGAAIPSAVVISGAWGTTTAKEVLGDNFAAAPLPSFEVDGQTYQIGSYSGNKLMGVKPQTDKNKGAVLQQLAYYLSSEECQAQRFEKFAWGPSNLNVQAKPEVQADVALSALAAQNAHAIPQGQIHGSWWDIAKVYATAAREAGKDDTAALKAALANYQSSIDALFSMSEEEKNAFTVIGSINGDGWTIDLPMTETEPGKWVTNEAYTMDAGVEFKCRQGKSWDVSFGKDGENFKVETAGTYKIQLTVTGSGDSMQGSIELIPG